MSKDDQLAAVVTKEEFQQFRSEILHGQDTMITILQRLDEERVFTNKWVEEIEAKVEQSRADIKKLKLQLHIT